MTQATLYPRIGAFLTGNPADEAVLQYVRTLLDGGVAREALFRAAVGDGFTLARARKAVAAALPAKHAKKPSVAGCEGDPLDAMLRVARDHELDLLVAGRRLPASRGGKHAIFGRLALKAPCSVLMVTQHSEPRFDEVLCPVDFSAASGRALRTAVALRDILGPGGGPVTCQTVFDVPYGAGWMAGADESFMKERRKQGGQEFKLLLKESKVAAGKARLVLTDAHEVAPAVTDLALALRADLVVVGSRGRSGAATILLGSVAERLVEQCAAPVLVVKEKGETLGFLEALLA